MHIRPRKARYSRVRARGRSARRLGSYRRLRGKPPKVGGRGRGALALAGAAATGLLAFLRRRRIQQAYEPPPAVEGEPAVTEQPAAARSEARTPV
jgi:hypothetical protein